MNFPQFLEKKFLEWQLAQGRKTIVEFAAYIGISQPLLSMWMNGKKKPGMKNAMLLAEIFGEDVYDALQMERPNPYLQRINKVFEFLPEDIQRRIAEEAETYEAKNEDRLVQQAHERRKKSKT